MTTEFLTARLINNSDIKRMNTSGHDSQQEEKNRGSKLSLIMVVATLLLRDGGKKKLMCTYAL